MDFWLPLIRLSRIQHNHIAQSDNGVPDCPACEAVDPYHQTAEYAILENYRLRNSFGGGWQ